MASTGTADIADLVIEHHRRLQVWLNTADASALDDFLGVHDPEFTLIGVDGGVISLLDLRALLERAGGTAPDLVIDIARVTRLASSGDLDVIRWHEIHKEANGSDRIVTAVLRNGLWLTVHESMSGQ